MNLSSKELKLESIQEIENHSFAYRVIFSVNVRYYSQVVTGQLSTEVDLFQGRRKRSPHYDRIEADARKQACSVLENALRQKHSPLALCSTSGDGDSVSSSSVVH